jgi:hypothetical protein
LFTDVTGQTISLIFKGKAVKEEGWTTDGSAVVTWVVVWVVEWFTGR